MKIIAALMLMFFFTSDACAQGRYDHCGPVFEADGGPQARKNLENRLKEQLGIDNVISGTIAKMPKSWVLVYGIVNLDKPYEDTVYFYPGNPLETDFVAVWHPTDRPVKKEIEAWALKNVPGIPKDVADCFAWLNSP